MASENDKDGDDNEVWTDFVAGWCSGAAAVLVCQPLDTVLTRLQANVHVNAATSSATSSTASATPTAAAATTTATTITRDARGLVSQVGLRSLWRGSSCMISAVPLQNALLMTGYGWGTTALFDGDDGKNSSSSNGVIWGAFVGGTLGGIVQSFLMSPVELVKVQRQVHVVGAAAGAGASAGGVGATSASVDSLYDTTSRVVRGLLSSNSTSWRGLTATLWRDGIPHGVWFASYQWCKDTMMMRCENVDADDISNNYANVTVPLVSGAFAATAAWTVGYPFDLIKTRIQARTSPNHTSMTMWQTAVQLHHETPGGLYRGFGLKLVRAIPASMIGFTVYEFVKSCITTGSGGGA